MGRLLRLLRIQFICDRRYSSPGGVLKRAMARLVSADSQVVSGDIGTDWTETRADIHIPAVTMVFAVHTFVVSVICCNLSPLSLMSVVVTCLRCHLFPLLKLVTAVTCLRCCCHCLRGHLSPLSLSPLSLVSAVICLRCNL